MNLQRQNLSLDALLGLRAELKDRYLNVLATAERVEREFYDSFFSDMLSNTLDYLTFDLPEQDYELPRLIEKTVTNGLGYNTRTEYVSRDLVRQLTNDVSAVKYIANKNIHDSEIGLQVHLAHLDYCVDNL